MQRNDYDVSDSIRTTDPTAVGAEVIRLYCKLFPHASPRALERAFADIARMYDGGDFVYWPCDTEYHDVQHVLDVTLAMARLMDGYQGSRNGGEALVPELFLVGTLAALFHDIGYLRRRNDHRHRYGAEYTITHVDRGAIFLRRYGTELGLENAEAQLAATLLHFTGYDRKPDSIRIGAGLPRLIGQLLGTADIIAQMSDRCYLEKCRDRLYPEFVLGNLGAPRGRRLPVFASSADLVAKTPGFYEGATRRLEGQLGRTYEYAARHFGGANLYLDGMRRNVSYVAGSPAPVLRRQPPYTLLPEVQPYPRDLFGLDR
ncbi:MAG TPA: HD domain-containing protein [Burkholderiales bacterium]